MQRLFSIFPNGWPGAGLLILRVASGGLLVAYGVTAYAANGFRTVGLLPLTTAIPGGLLLVGLWTPVAGIIAALLELSLIFTNSSELNAGILLVCISAAIAMLGPGCWSIDSVLFGRRRLDVDGQ